MVSCSDTLAPPDQTRWLALGALLWAISLGSWAAPAHAQVLCPAGAYSEDALALEGIVAAQVRRAGEPVLWAHEGLCARAELRKHWASLRMSHAFGQAAGPGVEQQARLLPEYGFWLRPLADTGALRLAALMQYEHDPLRDLDHRLQWAVGPRLMLLDDYRVRLGFTTAYYLELAEPLTGSTPGATAGWQQRSGLWLRGTLGFSPQDGVLWSEELLAELPVQGDGGFEPRGYLQSTLRVRGSAHLALEVAVLVAFDSGLPASFAPWDAVLRAGVVLSL